jgi:hypothetical protein
MPVPTAHGTMLETLRAVEDILDAHADTLGDVSRRTLVSS